MGGRFQAYPEYKNSGIEWLGDIPVHWEISKLRYMFTFGKGLTITKEHLLDEGIPCVNYGEVHSKYGFQVDPAKHPLKCVSEEYLKSSSSALLLKGDLVFADTSEDIDGSGNFTQLIGEQQVFAGYHTIIARPEDRSVSRFYAYLVDSQEFRAQIRNAVKGVKVFSVTQAMLRGANVWLPPEDEQQTITSFLDHETAKIDTLIEKQQQLIKLLKEKRQAVISHAVTKGLNPDAPMRDSGVEWLGEVPGHWVTKKSFYVFCSSPRNGVSPAISNSLNGIPTFSISAVRNGYVNIADHVKWTALSLDEAKKYKVESGDVLIVRGNGNLAMVGQAGVVSGMVPEKCIYPDILIKVKLSRSNMIKEFFVNAWNSFYVREQLERKANTANGTYKVSGEDIKNVILVEPPFEEQNLIVDYLATQLDVIDKVINRAEQAIILMQERRTALISAAVTGKIDVRNWQPPN